MSNMGLCLGSMVSLPASLCRLQTGSGLLVTGRNRAEACQQKMPGITFYRLPWDLPVFIISEPSTGTVRVS
jgi:hypothetical protein